jgi:hypothetical protein
VTEQAAAGVEIDADPALAPIRALCAGSVERRTEGVKNYILMPGLRFMVRGAPRQVDALLCLNHGNPSYPTKLFLAERIDGCGLNWNETAYILARSWHTWSWKDVSPNQRPIEILAGHLKAFK